MKLGVGWMLPAIAAAVACSGGTGPVAGTLNVNLATPHADDGGILLAISGGPVDSVEAVGSRVYTAQPDANTLRLIVTGDLNAGTIARLHIPDIREAANYEALLTQVAARSSYAQRDPALYSIRLLP